MYFRIWRFLPNLNSKNATHSLVMCTKENAVTRNYAAAVQGIHEALNASDDPAFWTTLLVTVLGEIDARWKADAPETRGIAISVSRVSHWARPNQTRWTKGGGFAWPESYAMHAEENADWQLWISRARSALAWDLISREPKSKRGHFRAFLAAPSGTARHPQGAAMLVWRPHCPYRVGRGTGAVRQMYGLRRRSAVWEVVAQSEFGERGT